MDATYIVQLLIALIAPLAALGGVWLTNRDQRNEKREEFERTKSQEREQRRIEASFDFLETFSKPIKRIIKQEQGCVDPRNGEFAHFALCEHRVDDLTPYLRAALRLREFGDLLIRDLRLPLYTVKIQGKSEQVQTLSGVIRLIMKLRYENESDLLSEKTLDEFEALRLIAVKNLSHDVISSMPWKQENTKAKQHKFWWREQMVNLVGAIKDRLVPWQE